MMKRLPVRIRLAAAFSAGLLVVLVLAGTFVYLRVGAELSRALDASLAARAADVATLVRGARSSEVDLGGTRLGEDDSTFTQLLTRDGSVVDSTPPGRQPVLDGDQIERARAGTVRLDGLQIRGIQGKSRIVAVPVQAEDQTLVAVVGVATSDREEALSGITRAFALGAPLAVLLASGVGYLLGARALAPVEAMRSQARRITFQRGGERLPIPLAKDELHNLADTLNEMLDRIETALQRERVFVSNASHELRTPLAILKSEIELVRLTGGSKEELEAALDSAAEEVDHLARLAEDLLVIARADQGRLPIRREPVDISALANRVGARYLQSAEPDRRNLVIDAGGVGSIEVDPLRIEQAISNLLDNALRHGAGTVTLRAERSAEGNVELSVSDEGQGFPQAFETEAFERFAQAAAARSDASAGLGLPIVRAIARAHGGEASVVRGAAAGAVVRITLPGSPTAGDEHEAPKPR